MCVCYPAGRYARLALTVLTLALALVLAACSGSGGGGGDEQGVLTLEADLGDLPETFDRGQFLDSIAVILTKRAEAFAAESGNVEVDAESARLTVTLEGGVSIDQAREILLARGQLDLRQIYLNPDGAVVCRPDSGDDFPAPTDSISYDTSDPSSRPLPMCTGADGQTGQVLWASPANPRLEATAGLPLTPTRATVDRSQAPVVFIELDPQGRITLQQLTATLVGMPLGIFVDGELMAGPTIEDSITDGLLVVGGLTLPEADILAAKLGAGPLPTTLTEVEPEPSD